MPHKKQISHEENKGMEDEEDSMELESTIEIVSVLEDSHNPRDRTDQFSFMDQLKMPRPCYYSLRILGVWQPKHCNVVFDVYSAFTYIIFLASVFSILGKTFNFSGLDLVILRSILFDLALL